MAVPIRIAGTVVTGGRPERLFPSRASDFGTGDDSTQLNKSLVAVAENPAKLL